MVNIRNLVESSGEVGDTVLFFCILQLSCLFVLRDRRQKDV